jgi:dihydroflavonol-4-reductase
VHVKDVAYAIIKAAEKSDNVGEKYIIGKQQINFKEFNKMISEISGVSLPLISMPDFLSISSAYLLTAISDIVKKPPIWGMAIDQMRTMKEGFIGEGSKAEKELNLQYTPVKKALEEQIAALTNLPNK